MSGPGTTKKTIADAMKQLMQERPFAKISVADIVERCSLNRNSFYYHFKDKFDLVNWIFYTEIVVEISTAQAVSISGWDLMERICDYFYRNRSFYANAMSASGQNSFFEYYKELMRSVVQARSKGMFHNSDYEDFYISFVVDLFIFATFRWLRDGANIPPKKIAELMKDAMTGTALKILNEPYADRPD